MQAPAFQGKRVNGLSLRESAPESGSTSALFDEMVPDPLAATRYSERLRKTLARPLPPVDKMERKTTASSANRSRHSGRLHMALESEEKSSLTPSRPVQPANFPIFSEATAMSTKHLAVMGWYFNQLRLGLSPVESQIPSALTSTSVEVGVRELEGIRNELLRQAKGVEIGNLLLVDLLGCYPNWLVSRILDFVGTTFTDLKKFCGR